MKITEDKDKSGDEELNKTNDTGEEGRKHLKENKERSKSRDREKGMNNNAVNQSPKQSQFEKFSKLRQEESEKTIYRPAVERESVDKNRLSSSSEEGEVNIKNKSNETSPGGESDLIDDLINRFIGTQWVAMERRISDSPRRRENRPKYVEDGEIAHCSRDNRDQRDRDGEDYRLEMEK